MAFYELLKSIDLMEQAKNAVNSGMAIASGDKLIGVAKLDTKACWIPVKLCPSRKCWLWFKVYFAIHRLVPSGCRNCWKVVFRPHSLAELFKTYELQRKLDLPAKCGIETREFVPGLYSAFWYAPFGCSFSEAKQFFSSIRSKIWDIFGSTRKVILKRGCTEMELYLGPSNGWEYGEVEEAREKLLDSVWVEPENARELLPPFMKNHIFKRWIEWAWQLGDETWKEFTSNPPYPSLVEYQDSSYKDEDFAKKEDGEKEGREDKDGSSAVIQRLPSD